MQGKDDLDSILEFLKCEVLSEERLCLARTNFGLDKNRKSYKTNISEQSNIATCSDLYVGEKYKDRAPTKKFDELCIFCDKLHSSEKCFKARTLSYEDRKNLVSKKGACFLCLGRNHISRTCRNRARVKCIICAGKHLSVMCQNIQNKPHETGESKLSEEKNNDVALTSHILNSEVLLQTLVVRVKNGNQEVLVRAIIDTGSERTYVTEDVIDFLNCESIGEVNLIHKLFGGTETNEKLHHEYKINLRSLDNKYNCHVYCLNESVICSGIKRVPKGPWLSELNKYGIRIIDVESQVSGIRSEIKLLIGADVAGKLLTGKIANLECGLTAINTKLGWTVMGKLNPDTEPASSAASLIISSLLVKNSCISDLWKLDVLGITDPPLSKTKAQLENDTQRYFEETLSVNEQGRYEVALPWILDNALLHNNKINAEKGLLSAKRKLTRAEKFTEYSNVFENWLILGIIERASTEIPKGVHYLPHRAIMKENSTTTLRPVFNASSHLAGFPSLNDCLSTGPNLIEMIPSILNRFRMNYVGVTSDIEKAFLQISIRKKDRDFLRFLWFGREQEQGRDQSIIEYRHQRVVFGITSSPYLLAATLQYHLDRVPENLKHTANILKTAFYVDNCVTSLHSEAELEKFFLESKTIMASGHFNLRCWKSNMNNEIFKENSAAEESVSLLGEEWHTETDTLSCKVPQEVDSLEPITKRTVLAVAHQIFDVIGYTAPVTLIPKLILQETWNIKLQWDDSLPVDLAKRFESWYRKLHLLSEIRIPRWFGIRPTNESTSLHMFCDSSGKAYGACVFIRVENDGGIQIRLVNARSRVAPLKPITIPRLELLACSIGSRLLSTITNDLNLNRVDIYCWTDSTTALCWIQRNQNWGTFIHNRVAEIRSLFPPTVWHHVPGTLNIADILSRGCSVEQLVERRWWEGPDWLRESEENWPKSKDETDENVVNSELRKTVITNLVNNDEVIKSYYRYFSSYKKIVRMLAWIFRFYNNVKNSDKTLSKDLSVNEIERGERALMLLIQKESFKGENDEKLRQLRPTVDCHGLLRAKSSVAFRDDKFDFKYPILLPSDHPVVHLLISWKHQELMHAGVSLLMTELRETFWILKARKTIRTVVQRCVRCKRYSVRKTETVPIALPADRVQDVAVFQVVGVDLAGPLYLKKGRKSWIVLYTCAVYRAVHLELVTSLSTEAFLQSFRRFIARRGRPTTVYSDNGTNFVGAQKALSNIDWERIESTSAAQKIKWKFNPPAASWWGGWWERLIQIVKRILRKVLGSAVLSYEELFTVLCDCERVLNSRPLTYVTEDIDDLSPITPSSFLHEVRSSDVTDFDFIDSQGLTNRLKYTQQVREHLRKRFRSEYLGQLRQQSVHLKTVKPLTVGDFALVRSKTCPLDIRLNR